VSDAKVTFHLLELCENGDPRRWGKSREPSPAGQEATFSFQCPKADRRCGDLMIHGRTGLKHDPNGQNGGHPHWNWDGNRDTPTFTPSVNCKGCWHGYIRGGRCFNTGGQEEPG
jgi:Family of unknown function (DUF6527)